MNELNGVIREVFFFWELREKVVEVMLERGHDLTGCVSDPCRSLRSAAVPLRKGDTSSVQPPAAVDIVPLTKGDSRGAKRPAGGRVYCGKLNVPGFARCVLPSFMREFAR
jgi:hypothetical protein